MILTMIAYPLFRFITYAGKEQKTSYFNSHNKIIARNSSINHPKHKYKDALDQAMNWCKSQDMKDFYIKSVDGLKLHATYLPAENPVRTVILCHGYKGSRFGSVCHMAEFLHDEGCNLLFIDQRCCDESEGKYITFGSKEQFDILCWIRMLHKTGIADRGNKINGGNDTDRGNKKLPIYIYGQSMGASSVLLASGHKLPSEVKGIIADCGFHSMKEQLRDLASGWFHLNRIDFMLLRVDLLCNYFASFRMKDTETEKALRKNRLPVLFFHGTEDTYVLPKHSIENYNACAGPKELVLVPGARHLCSSYENPELYKSKLTEFFTRYD